VALLAVAMPEPRENAADLQVPLHRPGRTTLELRVVTTDVEAGDRRATAEPRAQLTTRACGQAT
jgi:hypothetical protein